MTYDKGRWLADVRTKGTRHYLGTYDTAEDAARAYNKKARELYGEKAKLNPVEGDTVGAPLRGDIEIVGRKPKSSQYRGVSLKNNKWRVQLRKDRNLIDGGTYATEREAALAYNALARDIHGDKAKLNDV